MSRHLGPVLLATIAFAAGERAPAQTATTWARLAPYTGIVWAQDTSRGPRVLLGGQWVDLLSIDSIPMATILASAKSTYGTAWQKRFDEDLVEVLSRVGRSPRDTVVLGVRDTATGRVFEHRAAMTAANRTAIMQAKGVRSAAAPGTVPTRRPGRPATLTGPDIARDLSTLQTELEGRWAYLKTTGVDYRSPLAALRERAANGMTHAEYGLEVLKLISLFIDGHASVSGFAYPPGQIPFFIESTGERFVAILPNRSGFVDSAHPYITRMDDRPIVDWLGAARPFVSKASPQWMRRNALSHVGRVQFMRGVMGIAATDSVTVDVASRDGSRTRRLVMPVVSRAAGPARWPSSSSRVLEGNVGYLRLASMDAGAVTEIATWMPGFRDTRGLIIDVRGNTGGSRDALRALFPYLMTDTDTPRVVNAARYRLHPDNADDHLGGSRYMFRENWDGWNAAERAAIARFKTTFTPQWMPPAEEFSEWHYLVMSRRMNPGAYVYSRTAIVLLDEGSFSATDIFVAAFKGWRNVTLIGTPSGGGSARQIGVALPVSGLTLSLASMASFQLNGRLFDTNGTHPDVLVHPDADYFLVGGRDVVLERALERVK